MSWDDEFDEGYDDALEYDVSGSDIPETIDMPDKGGAEDGVDPMDITNPVSAFFFLSDDAQDELQGSDKRKIRCLSCGHRFVGETYDNCPKCFSSNTEELSEQNNSDPFRDL